MPPVFKPLILLPFLAALLNAAALPKAEDDPARNLEHYLEYRTQNNFDLVCKTSKTAYTCAGNDQRMLKNDGNGTTTVAFKKAALRFNAALGLLLQKAEFDATMKEIEQTELLRKKYLASKKPYLSTPSSPLQDALDRALVGNLEQVDIDGLDIVQDNPQAHISVKKIAYLNAMKRTAKDAAFAERIFGETRLTYTDASIDTNDTQDYYGSLPAQLDAWLGDTNDTARAAYVGQKLQQLYAGEARVPSSGFLLLRTASLGNDALRIDFTAENTNRKKERASLVFAGELRNASSLFTPARKPRTPGTPDLLFGSLLMHSGSDAGSYRALLKQDKRFAGYIAEYDALLRAYFDRKLKRFAYSPVLTSWLKQAKSALSATVTGKADTLDIAVRNRSGTTAMQVFGMLMGQLLATPAEPVSGQPDTEKIIADTAAANLEVQIEAH